MLIESWKTSFHRAWRLWRILVYFTGDHGIAFQLSISLGGPITLFTITAVFNHFEMGFLFLRKVERATRAGLGAAR